MTSMPINPATPPASPSEAPRDAGDERGLPSPAIGRVRALNDALRRSFIGGQVVETPGVVALPEAERVALLFAVRRFDQFDAGNDPHGEHDFGAVEVGAARYFWKIDAYDQALAGHSPDPADPGVTTRVLTIMRADEY